MGVLETRLAKLEERAGEPNDLWLRSLSDGELEEHITLVQDALVAAVEAGQPVPEISPAEWEALLQKVATHGRCLVECV